MNHHEKTCNTLYYPWHKPERMTVAGEWTDSAATIQSRDRLGWYLASSPAPCWCWNSVAAKFSSLSPHCDLLWLLGPSVYRNLPRMRINSGARTCPACLLVWEQRRAHCLSCPPFSAPPPVTCLASLLTTSPLFPVISHEPRPSLHLSRHQLHVNGITQAVFPCRSHL